MDLRSIAIDAARKEGIDPDLFLRLIKQESGFQPHVQSSAGAYGPAQLMPATAAGLGVDYRDPVQNIYGGAKYFRQQMDTFGAPELALAAYNAGPGAVKKYGGIPPYKETKNYVRSIMGSDAVAGGAGNDRLAGGTSMGLLDMPEEPQTFKDRLRESWKSGELLDNLALAANSLRMRPDPNMAAMIQGRQEKRAGRETVNRTAQWLISQGREDLAQALMTGAIDAKTAVAMAMQKKDAVKAVEVNGKLVNPETGEVLYDGGPDQKEAFGNEVELMKSYRSDPAVQAYGGVSNYYGRMVSAYDETVKNPQAAGAGDLAMVYSYMKMLDPGSTVMQGEYASASNTSGVPDQIRNAYNNILNGSKLTEAQRLAFIQQAGGMLSSTATGLNAANEVYGSTASRFGVNPGFIIKPISPRAGGSNGSTTGVVPPPELPSLQVIPRQGL